MAKPQLARKRRRAVAYVRVSKGRENMISPDIQIAAIQAWADRNDTEIVKVIQDLSLSGRKFEKRAVPDIVEAIRAGEYDTVLLWKWSRWGRNATMSGAYLVRVEDAGGSVISATEDIDPETIIGRFTRTVLLAVAELESDMKSEGWKETHEQRRVAQLPHSGSPRYGYEYVTVEGHKKYVTSPVTGPILRNCYKRYIAGTSLRTLALGLNKNGNMNTQGSYWSPQSLGYVLDTGFAAGWIREKSDEAKKKNQSKAFTAFDVWWKGSQETLISEEEWDEYRLQRLSNSKKPPRDHRPQHALSGLVYCGLCGTRCVVQYTKQKGVQYLSWRCKRRADKGEQECIGVTLSDRRCQEALLEWIVDKGKGVWSSQIAEESRNQNAGDRTMSAVQNEMAATGKQLDRLLDLYLNERVDQERYDRRKAELESDLEDTRLEMRRIRDAESVRMIDPRPRLKAIRAEWMSLDPEKQNLALREVVARLDVQAGPWGPDKVRVLPSWEA